MMPGAKHPPGGAVTSLGHGGAPMESRGTRGRPVVSSECAATAQNNWQFVQPPSGTRAYPGISGLSVGLRRNGAYEQTANA